MDGRTDGRTGADGWTDGWAHGRTDERTDGRADGQTDGAIDYIDSLLNLLIYYYILFDFVLNSIDLLCNPIDFLFNLMLFQQTFCFLLIPSIFDRPTHHFERPFRSQLAAKKKTRSEK